MGWPLGKPRPLETRAKMSAAKREHFAGPAGDETRAKMSAAQRGHYACFHCGAAFTRDGAREKMQPVDGLAGRFECCDEAACSRRIAKSLPSAVVAQCRSISA